MAKDFSDDWSYYGERVNENMETPITDEAEVVKICREIKVMKSSGMAKLSSKICKDAFLALSTQLTHLFNCSLRVSVFPNKWKVPTVVPLHKGGDREEVNNYRPVSLLPLPGKILENIVHKGITGFLDDNDVLCHSQGGFRKGFSTVSTIADLTDDLFRSVNKGDTTLAAFIDLKKAFDTVDFDILQEKLSMAGIRNNMLDWCKSYLSSRYQCVTVNKSVSNLRRIKSGVPQGSVLGPLLFMIYINDLRDALDVNSGAKLYADNTVIYCSGIEATQVSCELQANLNRFSKWCKKNKLTVNTKKTKLMSFGTRTRVKKAKNVTVTVNGDRIQMVPSYKYLGVILDSTLSYNMHISSLIRTVLHKVTLLSKVKRYLNDCTALLIYKSMILPYLDYADVIFDRAYSKDLGKLQRLQNRCLKICSSRDRLFNTDLAHKLANAPFLSDRRAAHTLNFMYKRKARKELLNNREIRTRAHDAPLFLVDIPRCAAFQRSVGYFGSESWNKLPPAIRNTDSYAKFKGIQKKSMLQPLTLIPANH